MNQFEIVDAAIKFAVDAHAGQTRKSGGAPVILHPLEAAAICATITLDPEVIAAAALHDTVEDTKVTVDQLREAFGPRVARIVAGESEDKREGSPASSTWKLRKQEFLDSLENACEEELVVSLCDKLSNMRSFHRDVKARGDAIWNNFNQKDPHEHAWYYRSIAQITKQTLGHTDAWTEYNRLTEEVFSRYDS